MMVDITYYAVFFKSNQRIGHKRINRHQWENLTDGVIIKQVELEKVPYDIINIKTFHIRNSVDNTRFAVCDVE